MIRITLFLLLLTSAVFAGDPQYPVSAIPEHLLKNANVVLRLQEETVKLNDLKDMRITHHIVLTILNESGEKYSGWGDIYSKDREIRDVRGALYDAAGNLVRKLKQSEIKDVSAVSENNLMDDNRLKMHDFYYKVYPYTIEYEVEYRYRTTLFFRPWFPQPGKNFSVEQSRIAITVPTAYQLRYRQFNYPGQPAQTTDKDTKTYTWEIRDRKAFEGEVFSGPLRDRTVAVYFSPSDFIYGDYTGKMNTWDDYGKFQLQLNAGRDQLPDKVKAEVHTLADGWKDPKEKAKVLYEYMQKHTRYISIQLGIGGWQPFDATYVATKGYGDCKALCNYMFSLLKEAGIRSHYTLVKAGKGETDLIEDFTVDQFNHIILCVPTGKDTTWLECTSQTEPFGYLGSFTSGRTVLLVDEQGGKLVRTPVYAMDQNRQVRHFAATINENGDLSGNAETTYTGLQQDWYHGMINNTTPEKQLDKLKENLNLPSYNINKFHYTAHPQARPVPEMDELLDITVPNYASISGKRMFIVPNVLNRSTLRLTEDSTRVSDIYLGTATKDVDTLQITIPNGYTPESVFPEVKQESRFGKYTASVKVEGNKLTYVRCFERKAGVFPARDFPALEEFYNAVYKWDRSRIIFVKAQ